MIKNKILAREAGFTLVELAVVITIIAILAAIGYVAYDGVQDRARAAVLRSDLKSAAEVLHADFIRSGGRAYPTDMGDADKGTGLPASVNTLYQYTVDNLADPPTFCLTGTNGMVALHVTEEGVISDGICSGHDEPVANDGGVNDPNQTVFVFDTSAPGCGGTVQLPVSAPTSGGTIDWGDGTTEPLSASLQQYTYSEPGTYTVTYDGPISQASYYASVNATNAKCLTEVSQWGANAQPTHASFYNASNLAYVAEPPSSMTSFTQMFNNATSFNQAIDSWSTANIRNMSGMFYGATSFNQPLSSWNTSNVIDMQSMFRNSSFNQSINDWNTSKVTNMFAMFYQNSSFNQPLNSWDVSKVTNMQSLFGYATSFNQPLNSWNTSSATNMNTMFYVASSFNQNIAVWNVNNVTTWSSFRSSSALSTANTPSKFQ